MLWLYIFIVFFNNNYNSSIPIHLQSGTDYCKSGIGEQRNKQVPKALYNGILFGFHSTHFCDSNRERTACKTCRKGQRKVLPLNNQCLDTG